MRRLLFFLVLLGTATAFGMFYFFPEDVNTAIRDGQIKATSLYKTASESVASALNENPNPNDRIDRNETKTNDLTSTTASRARTFTPVPTPVQQIEPVTPTQGEANKSSGFFKNIKELAESTQLTQPEINLGDLERDIHDLVNAERIARSLNPLAWDDEIALIARRHSQNMASNGYFSHENLQGQRPVDRGNEAGYECIKVYSDHYTFGLSENIFQGWLYSSTTYINGVQIHDWNTQEDIARTSVDGWMESEGHRKNILTKTYDRAGIGIAVAENNKVYITQNFC